MRPRTNRLLALLLLLLVAVGCGETPTPVVLVATPTPTQPAAVTVVVTPPPEAIPAQIKEVTLALGADENYEPVEPTTAFAFDETVYLVGRGDLGLGTSLQAEWYVGGQLDEAGTRRLTLEENAPDVGFAFSYLPEGGWPPGEHAVVLIVNDQEVGRYPFTVVPAGGAAPLDETAFWDAFPLPDDAEIVPVVEGYDLGFATSLLEPQLFDYYAAWLRGQGWQQQAPTEAMITLPHQRWRKDDAELLIEIQRVDDQGRTIVWVQLTLPAAGAPPQPIEPARVLTPENVQQLTEMGQTPVGPTRPDLAWSPDGRWLALAREDTASGTAWLALFDAQNLTPADLPAPVRAAYLAFSPDGRFLATSFHDDLQDRVVVRDAARLFDREAAEVSSFSDTFGGILGLTFSPDSRLIALAVSAAQGSIVPLLEAESGQLERVLQVSYLGSHAPLVQDVAFSPDGALLAAALYGGAVQIWRVADGSPLVTVQTGATQPNRVAFLSADRFVTTGFPTAFIWDLNGDQLAALEGSAGLAALDVTPDGSLIAGAMQDRVGLWDAADGRPLRSIATPSRVLALRFGPGARLALLTESGALQMWGLAAEQAQAPPSRYTTVWQRLGQPLGAGQGGYLLPPSLPAAGPVQPEGPAL